MEKAILLGCSAIGAGSFIRRSFMSLFISIIDKQTGFNQLQMPKMERFYCFQSFVMVQSYVQSKTFT